jgi:proteasome lid subunit RPN8/RPN11
MFDPAPLVQFYTEDKERIGFVLKTGEVIETENICDDPQNGFDFRGEDLLRYAEIAHASWHTHPGVSSNLSEEDRRSFLDYPDLTHYIVGNDGVSEYVVENGSVIYVAAYPLPRDL